MRSKSQTAWETAARCATLAQEADDPQEREHYTRLRDAWITLARRCEPFDFPDVTGNERGQFSKGEPARGAKGGVSGTLMEGGLGALMKGSVKETPGARQRFLTERPAQTSPPAEVFGVIETALRSHFAKEIPA